MSRLLITGATGFLGSHLLEALMQKNFEIVGLVRSEVKAKRLNNIGRRSRSRRSSLSTLHSSCRFFNLTI